MSALPDSPPVPVIKKKTGLMDQFDQFLHWLFTDSGESNGYWNSIADFIENLRFAVFRDVMRHFKITKRTCTCNKTKGSLDPVYNIDSIGPFPTCSFGVYHSFRNPLTIKVGHLVEEGIVL